jgi:hypothetical protein
MSHPKEDKKPLGFVFIPFMNLRKTQTDQQPIQHQDYLQDKTHFKELTDENQTRKESSSNSELHL